MEDPSDEINEVALNVLRAEGVDFPTALEASRRGSGVDATRSGCFGVAVLFFTVTVAVATVLL